jgi:hypothetical protein
MPAALNLRLTEAARSAIDASMANVDHEGVPALLRSWHHGDPREKWTVGCYDPGRIRFFEQLARVTGLEFFFDCDGLILLMWQPNLAPALEGKTLDYSFRRYVVR